MTTPRYNLLAARKTIGAIHHRLQEQGFAGFIRRRIIQRQLDDLLDTLPSKFEGIIRRCIGANGADDTLELVAGLALIESMLPKPTYGIIPAGTIYYLPGEDALWRKSKSGKVSIASGVLYQHPDASTVVEPVNW